MTYTWDIQTLKRVYKKLFRLGLYNEAASLNELLTAYDLNSYEFDASSIDGINTNEYLDYYECLSRYKSYLDKIPDELKKSSMDTIKVVPNKDSLLYEDFIEYKDLNLSDNDLVVIAKDIISSLGNKDINKLLEYLLNPKNHVLNIQKSNESTLIACTKYGGVTFKHPYFKDSLINVFRENNINDIVALTHELLHAIYFNLYYKEENELKLNYLDELEGRFGSILAQDFLYNHGFEDEAIKSRMEDLKTFLITSYLLNANEALFNTSDDTIFNLNKALKYLKNSLNDNNLKLEEKDLNNIFSINGFNDTNELICYLTILDIWNKDISNEEKLRIVLNLKKLDSYNIEDAKDNNSKSLEDNLDENGITFFKDGLHTLTKEYKKFNI